MHDIKTQAHHLRTLLKARGLTLKHAEVLELAAQANGYKDWQTARAAETRAAPQPAPAPAPLTIYALHHDGSVWVYASGGEELGFFAADGWDRDMALMLFTQNLLALRPSLGAVTFTHKDARVLDDAPADLSPGEYLEVLIERHGPAFLETLPALGVTPARTLTVMPKPAKPRNPARKSPMTLRCEELLAELTAAFREVYGPGAARVEVSVIRDENNPGYSTHDGWRVVDARGQDLPVAWAFIEARLPEVAADEGSEAAYLEFSAADRDTQLELQQAAAEIVFDLGNALSHWIDDLHETRDFTLILT